MDIRNRCLSVLLLAIVVATSLLISSVSAVTPMVMACST